MVDGNGILHTRKFGCASHIGVQFDIPTIGVAKKPFDVDGLNKSLYKVMYDGKLNKAGDYVPIVGKSGKTWGAALRCTKDSINPIYVSIGHRVSLETAINITLLNITKYRIPEPIR
jgi:deoxyinosine 3'endonuclease (endonuclease V)